MTWIDEVVLGLFDTYGTYNPYELCDLLEILVKKVNIDCPILSASDSIYIRDYFGREVIFIRNDLNSNHEEFYLRHELGHALLHTKIYNSGLCNLGKLELQANYFAFKLSDLNFDEAELQGMTIEQIACCLEVPLEPLKQIANI